jgi:hypothetical protein
VPAANRPCETREPEWWDTGDDGNRLALKLCAICPGCFDDDPKPYGVIRRGVPFGDDSKPRALCACGYPAENLNKVKTRNPVQLCRRCQLPSMEPYRAAIIRWRDRGDTYTDIARRIAFSPDHVSKKYREWTADREAVRA